MKIAIDVDGVIVDSITPWFEWFTDKTGIEFNSEMRTQYECSFLMENLLKEHKMNYFDPYCYWKSYDLYDKLQPISGSIEAIKQIEDFHKIVFVSSCHPFHENSKKKFLLNYFGSHYAFVSTKHKYWVDYDLLIDDCYDPVLINSFYIKPDKNYILFTEVGKDNIEQPFEGLIECNSWKEVLGFLYN